MTEKGKMGREREKKATALFAGYLAKILRRVKSGRSLVTSYLFRLAESS